MSRCLICYPNEASQRRVIRRLNKVTIRRDPSGKPRLLVTPNEHISHIRYLLKLEANSGSGQMQSATSLIFGSDIGEVIN